MRFHAVMQLNDEIPRRDAMQHNAIQMTRNVTECNAKCALR